MDFLHVFILAILQGITEFLPISSSAHLILFPKLFGWPDQGLAFDIAVHVGTLFAVITYFRKELKQFYQQSLTSSDAITDNNADQKRLFSHIFFATIPLILFGLIMHEFIANELRSIIVISITTIVFALVLLIAEKRAKKRQDEYNLSLKQALIIGCAQAIALIPGTSRSGITISAGLLLGLTDKAALRFSFLLSIPAIILSGGFKLAHLSQTSVDIQWLSLIYGAIISSIIAYLTIHYFIKLVDKIGFLPFVIYRVILGVILLGFLF